MKHRVALGWLTLSLLSLSLLSCGGSAEGNLSELDRLRQEQQSKKGNEPMRAVTPLKTDVSAYLPQIIKDVDRSMHKIDAVESSGWYAFAGDTMDVSLSSRGKVKCDIYNVGAQRKIKTLEGSGDMSFSYVAPATGIYAMQVSPTDDGVSAQYSVSLPAPKEGQKRPQVKTATESCARNAFMAYAVESVKSKNIFPEPKKIGLRSQFKSAFSGNSRAVITMNIPAGAKSVVYTLRVSNNEKTTSSDGKLESNLMSNKKKIKIFGIPLYQRERSYDIGSLFVNARPPREEDAFCNMYVLNGKRDVRTFQDTTSGSAGFNYDVDLSQLGTQSTIGEFPVGKNSTLYLGFENERLRYDTYIWLEAVAFIADRSYSRPVFSVK